MLDEIMIRKKEKIMKAISNKITADEARKIAKEAYIFTYGLVMNYRTMYRQAIDGDRAFGKWLHLDLSTPADRTS